MRSLTIILLLVSVHLSGCGEPCEDMLNSVCKVRPNKVLCDRLSHKIKRNKMSPELCGEVEDAYWQLMEQRVQE